MFTPPHRRDRTKYCEFHGDHGHDTNSCIDLRKEIENCIRNGHLSHLAKGARTQNSSQNPGTSRTADRGKGQVEWPRKQETEILMIGVGWCDYVQKEFQNPIPEISFSSNDPIPENNSGDNSLVIKANIGGNTIHQIYVDGGSSTEIMYDHCFQLLSNEQKSMMQPSTTPLVGFVGHLLWPLGVITLPLTMFDYRGRGNKTVTLEFMVVSAPSPYNVILGRPGIRKLGTVASTIHSLIKFPIPYGIAIVQGCITRTNEYLKTSRKRERGFDVIVASSDKGQQCDRRNVMVNQHHPDQQISIGTGLSSTITEKLCKLLCDNQDIFA